MVDAGETVSATLKREFGEEALNSVEATEQEKKKIETQINELFKAGDQVEQGQLYHWDRPCIPSLPPSLPLLPPSLLPSLPFLPPSLPSSLMIS